MLIRLFSILDSAAEAFNTPFTARTVAEAMRNFSLSVSNDPSVKRNARDYVLYEVGSFDISSGVLGPIEPKRIFSAAEAIQKFEEELERLQELTPNAQK